MLGYAMFNSSYFAGIYRIFARFDLLLAFTAPCLLPVGSFLELFWVPVTPWGAFWSMLGFCPNLEAFPGQSVVPKGTLFATFCYFLEAFF